MKAVSQLSRWSLGLSAVSASLFAFSQSAYAQGCALCYTQAAQSGGRMIQALKSGILILIVPPTLLTLAMVKVCYNKRDEFHDPESTGESSADW